MIEVLKNLPLAKLSGTAVALLVAFGLFLYIPSLGQSTPEATTDETKLNELVIQVEENTELIRALARGECLDRDPRELALMGIDCRGLGVR